jgi:hypothetical protein
LADEGALSLGDINGPHDAAYWAASVGPFPELTSAQESAVLKQAFLEQKMRADSNLRAWVAAMVLLVATNLGWIAWVIWK